VTNKNRRVAAACFAAAVLMTSVARAEEPARAGVVLSPRVIERGIAEARQLAPRQFAARPRQQASSASTGRRVLWTSIGAAGGFFAGGYAGAWIENAVDPCHCDDPGLKGALIGMPIGAVAGGISGFLLSK
jgi:hypothetical protein